MPIILKETLGPQVPTGTHIAICFRIVDIGTQPNTGYGEKHKLVINWELPHERIQYDGKDAPMVLSKIYSLSLNKKASLRKDLVAWRGRDFTAAELEGFELKAILGKACQVTVTHNEEGRAKVDSVVGLPKGMNPGEPANPLVEYSIDEGKNRTLDALPEWLRKMCNACLEWQGTKETVSEPDPIPSGEEPPPEDVPF